ncbi:MAG: DUF4239 domain-containing protein [Cyanobacteria bacterium REEB67]|nr:DUF4239 domain-containing protein [Cyanobacteria bacterium REEB67]
MALGEWAAITGLAVGASCGGILLIRKFIKTQTLKDHHEATDPMMACVGTLFAILLGFMVANAMGRFENARQNVQEEAGAVGDVFRLARGLPSPCNTDIMKNCVAYLDAVSPEEFAAMRESKMSDKCWDIYSKMWDQCISYDPQTQGQSNLHQGLVEAMTKFGECRRARSAQLHYALPPVLWTVVFIGAAAIIIFTFFFGVENVALQVGMTAAVTIILSLNIYLLKAFDSPFDGQVYVSPIPFEANKKLFSDALAQELNHPHK